MEPRHESLFVYPISRPYPFKWFTPTVLIAGFVLAALFSTVNFYANGFELENQSTSNPPEVVTRTFKNLPSFLQGKIIPQCQPLEIPVDSTIWTNQTALNYRVKGVRQCSDGVNWAAAPSLRYYNDIIQGCTIMALTVTLESRGQTPQQRAWNQWAPKAEAFINCNISNEPDPIFNTDNPLSQARVNLTTEYSYVPEGVFNPPLSGQPSTQGLTSMVYEDQENKASMWWGSSLLSAFWVQVAENMTTAMADSKETIPLSKGVIYFTRNMAVNDIESLDFFNIDYRFYQDNADGTYNTFFANDTSKNNFSPRNIAAFDSHQTYPNIWIPADGFAKSFYSTILSDLGQVGSPSNILADTKHLTYFTSNFSQIIANVPRSAMYAIPGPAKASFADYGSHTGPLGVTRSKIMAQFLCQVPKYRPGFDIFISILVQDLVMLNAVWRLYTLIVGMFFLTPQRAGPEVNHCAGCAAGVSRIADLVRTDFEAAASPLPHVAGMQTRHSGDKWQVNTSYQPVIAEDYRSDYRTEPEMKNQRNSAPLLSLRSTFSRQSRNI